MVDAWGGWSLFQTLLQTLKKVSLKHGVPIATVAVRYILNQVSYFASEELKVGFMLFSCLCL